MHNSRKKSGHGSANTSMTDVRKSVTATDPARYKRPTTLSRRSTPVVAQKLGRSPREREREWQESWEDERESFPQYCMTCEKQFVPQDEKFLYCSEACRKHDLNSSGQEIMMTRGHGYSANYPFYASGDPEPRDIIPRASPSRPSSTHFSPPTTPGALATHQHHSSAVSALRSLNVRPPSPPSPTSGQHPGLWPFTRSAATSPSTSYTRGSSGFFSSTYDGGYGASGYGYNYSTSGMDRPLPPTRRPSGYSRPKSIELVTPMVGR